MQVSSFLVGPHKTPKCVKWLIWVTVLTSLLAPILTYFVGHYFHLPGPGAWFSLSLWGIEKGWLWEPLTYFFLHSAGVGITLSLLITLFFHMLLLWFAGSEIAFRFGSGSFFLFYFGGGVVSGIVSGLALYLFSSQSLIVGSGPPVYALLLVWAMIYPELEFFFLFLIRIKAKWLVAVFLGIALLINLSFGEFIPFLADVTGIVWGFLIGRFVWKLPNPYPLNLEFPTKKKKDQDDKIIDISVFQEKDDAFMDRMLEKIAERGESSLTKREQERMKKISDSKRSNTDSH